MHHIQLHYLNIIKQLLLVMNMNLFPILIVEGTMCLIWLDTHMDSSLLLVPIGEIVP